MAARRYSVYIGQSLFWVVLLAACSGGSSQKGVFVGSRKAANSQNKPCQNSGQQKLAGDALNLTVDNESAFEEGKGAATPLQNVRAGGHIFVTFNGYETRMPEFIIGPLKDGITKRGVDNVAGNPNGVVEVLQIPYCVASGAFESSPDTWIDRCLNARDQKTLENAQDPTVKPRLIEALKRERAPKRLTKVCTANFSMDYDDVMNGTPKPRVRVMTAEHCYQPSYHDGVTLQVFLPQEKSKALFSAKRGLYIPIKIDSDGGVWRKKVLAVGGGGGAAGDAKLREKILLLRSMDGRTSDLYRSTFEKYCLAKPGAAFLPKFSDGKPASIFDCYAMTDISTFKGTVDLAHDIPFRIRGETNDKSERRSAARKAAFDFIAEESKKGNNTDVDNFFAANFPDPIRKQITVNKFSNSLYDGLLHARRMRAFAEELGGSKPDLSSFSEYFVSPKTDVTKFDFSTPEATTKTLTELAQVLTGADKIINSLNSAFCRVTGSGVPSIPIFGGSASQDCMADFAPPDTARLEDIALNRQSSKDPLEFLGKRLNVLIAAIINNGGIDASYPLYISPTDSAFRANLKVLAMSYTLFLDIAMYHKNPGRNTSLIVQGAARGLQNFLKATCAAETVGPRLFPIFGNVRLKDDLFKRWSTVLPIKLNDPSKSSSSKLIIVPIDVRDLSDYQPSGCRETGIAPNLGVAKDRKDVNGNMVYLPSDTVYGVYVNDGALGSVNKQPSGPGEKTVDEKLVDYLSSRVVMKFEGSDGESFQVAGHSDSGALLSLMGLPAFVLSAALGVPINGVILAEPPELNDPNPIGDSVGGICD
ncbi:MAG: hypothetical protein RL189_666 [Pseudomonadota bacterium]|jgi:hypothetical protein